MQSAMARPAMRNGGRVLIGISGGVDSGVSTALLLQQGYAVSALYIKMRPDDFTGYEDARRICDMLSVPLFLADMCELFSQKIITNFLEEYQNGRTPNPCVLCNPAVKFKTLLSYADNLGFDFIATGHYARLKVDQATGRTLLLSSYSCKDQSYVLYALGQEILSRLLLPLGEFYDKSEIRAIAQELSLPVADKADSQEICFIPDNDYPGFLKKHAPDSGRPGDILSLSGEKIGKHTGIVNYTIGQRKGLGAFGKPTFVTAIDPAQNTITVGGNEDTFSNNLVAGNVSFIPFDQLSRPLTAQAKIRSKAPLANCTVTPMENQTVRVEFEKPQRAVTPGQSVVFYDGEVVLGGGIIL